MLRLQFISTMTTTDTVTQSDRVSFQLQNSSKCIFLSKEDLFDALVKICTTGNDPFFLRLQ